MLTLAGKPERWWATIPTLRTEITEIITGLGMLGIESLDIALHARPAEMLHVTADNFDRLTQAWAAGEYGGEFEDAWDNGQAFALAVNGLRGRKPQRVEWKGNHKPPGYEHVPADLRVDYVYLVSCKYKSKILHNVSPPHLFNRLLTQRRGARIDWYSETAPTEYQNLYQACRHHLGAENLPESVADLGKHDRQWLKKRLPRHWAPSLAEPYRLLCNTVSQVSAQRWQKALGTRGEVHEETLWRLLRLQSAPYFVLGTAPDQSPMRYRVDTPWDFRQKYAFRSFDLSPAGAGQPKVKWRAALTEKLTDSPIHVDGHVEVRWSHGRFSGAPEAKVYLDTLPRETAGYTPLE